MSTETEIQAALDIIFEEIARKHLSIETLTVRNSDSLDFHEVGVSALKSALQAAYSIGLHVGKHS